MKLITIGRFTEKLNYKTNLQDYTTWMSMSKYFDSIYIIVESPDNFPHNEEIGKLNVFWIKHHSSSFWGRQLFAYESYKLAKRLIKEKEIDIINIGEPAVSGIPAIILKKRLKKPLVTQIQGQLLDIPKKTFGFLKTIYIKTITRITCINSDKIRTVSDEIRTSIIKLGIDPQKIITVPPRCNTKVFDPSLYSTSRQSIRERLGYSEDDIVIIFTGRIVEYRDLESDLIAMKKVLKTIPFFRFLIVGDGNNRSKLETMTQELGISKQVLFYGAVPFEDVPKVLAASDIFLSTPTNEGIARSVLEAMAMELPVIATKVGGTPEAIISGTNGILVDVKSPDQICNALLSLADAEKRKTIGKKARVTISEKFEFDKSISMFANLHLNLKDKENE